MNIKEEVITTVAMNSEQRGNLIRELRLRDTAMGGMLADMFAGIRGGLQLTEERYTHLVLNGDETDEFQQLLRDVTDNMADFASSSSLNLATRLIDQWPEEEGAEKK